MTIERSEARAHQLINEHAHQPFDLEAGPLLRAQLLCLAPEKHLLLLNVHHIASDGWSVGVFDRELSAAYAAFVKGQLQMTFPTQGRLASVTGLPVLGTLSEVITPPERARRRQRLVWLGGATAALGASWVVLMMVEFWQRSGVA